MLKAVFCHMLCRLCTWTVLSCLLKTVFCHMLCKLCHGTAVDCLMSCLQNAVHNICCKVCERPDTSVACQAKVISRLSLHRKQLCYQIRACTAWPDCVYTHMVIQVTAYALLAVHSGTAAKMYCKASAVSLPW